MTPAKFEDAETGPPEGEPAERLWRVWEEGDRPDLAAFLAPYGALTPAQLAAVLRLDQRLRWEQGRRIPAETYLREYPSLQSDDECALELVYGEFLLREELGESPSRDDYVRRFPQFADRLGKQFALHQALQTETLANAPPPSGQLGDFPVVGSALPLVTGYEILNELGRGGMGVVYRAWQQKLKRVVALKVMLAGDYAGPEGVGRFRIEAEAMARLQHPNIVQVHEIGEQDGRPFLALEYVEGGSLARKLAGTPLASAEAARLVEVTALAMHAAHLKGVVHRDLKPANVLLTADGAPKVTDFGLAKLVVGGSGQTESGAFLGSPSYMAPEQAGGDSAHVGPPADVYALGALLYEALTGRPPFRGATVADTVRQVMSEDPVSPRRLCPTVPRDLETICLKCLKKTPKARYATAADLASDLGRFLAGEPVWARPSGPAEHAWKWARRRPAAAAALAVAVLAAATLLTGGLWYQGRLEDAVVYAHGQRDEAGRARVEAEHNLDDARQATAAMEAQRDEAFQNLYLANLPLAQRAWQAARVGRVLQLLEAGRPRRADETDLRRFEWFYLWRLSHAAIFTLQGHTDAVDAVAFSADGKYLASGGQDGAVRLWDAAAGREAGLFQNHGGRVNGVAFSPDGRLAVGGAGGVVSVWDPSGDIKPLALTGHEGWVYGVAFSADGKWLASAGADRTVRVWDANEGKLLQTLKGSHGNSVTGVAFSPDGGRLASACADGTLRVWDLKRGKEILSLPAHSGWMYGVAFSPDGKRLASAGFDRSVTIWDAATGEVLSRLKGHTDQVRGVAFSPDGKRLASASYDQTVKVWDPVTGKELFTLKGHAKFVNCVAFHPDGMRLASAGGDLTVKLWDATAGQESLRLEGHSDSVTGLAFSPDGSALASCGKSGAIRLWDAAGCGALPSIGNLSRPLAAVAYSADGKRLASAGDDRTVMIWRTAGGGEAQVLRGHRDRVKGLAFSPDGRLASASADHTVKIWGPAGGKELLTFEGHTKSVLCVAFSPDGKRVASGGQDRVVKIWDAGSGREIRSFAGHDGWVTCVAFSPDGGRLASAGSDGTVRVWDADAGRERLRLENHVGRVTSLAFDSHGERIASGGFDETVRIWDLRRGEELLTLQHGGPVYAVAFSADGRKLASAGADPAVRVWDSTTPAAPAGLEP